MPEDTADASPDEQALASMFRKLERSLGRPPDMEELLRQHPHLAGEIRDLNAMRQALDLSRAQLDGPMPQRLGEFRIVRRLETGGMGDVYEAWQEPLHRRVAIKVLRHGHHSPSTQERFMREQRVLAQLHQTNIVPIHTAGQEGPFEYFAMPFIDGAALRHVVQAAVEFRTCRPGSKTPSIADLIGLAQAAPKVQRAGAAARTAGEPVPASESARRTFDFRPSLEYLRSVARVMADAAQAVQHAHEQGVLHRDIKPSNIMVEAHATAEGRRADQCWVIDFGLASYRSDGSGAEKAFAGGISVRRGIGADAIPTISGVMGTPAYMAPEQFEGRADERADVWGLGVTLYELLTLKRAFPAPDSGSDVERYGAVRELVRNAEPPRPRGVIPRDLEAICFRALRKDPAQRYASAGELADDLRRWLRREAVSARCAETPSLAPWIRCVLWAQRNKGWAAALSVTVTAILIAVAIGFLMTDADRRKAERAYQLQQLELVGSQPRGPGWSSTVRTLAMTLRQGSDDERLREAFAATLAGLDARLIAKRVLWTSGLALDASGSEVLFGGAPEGPESPAIRGGSWRVTAEPEQTGVSAPGPVAFRPDGTRVQFVHLGGLDFSVRDLSRNVELAACPLPGGDPALDRPVLNEILLPVMAMAADGSVVAASTEGTAVVEGERSLGAVCVWDGTGQPLGRFPVRATALVISADGELMGAGDAEGAVSVWNLRTGERLVDVPGSEEVEALAFGVNPVVTSSAAADGLDFQLAIGCRSGRIEVWDPVQQRVRTTCRGMRNRVLSLAFNPDGTLLAAGGGGTLLWDCATGAALLDLGGVVNNAVAFSGDGHRLAVASYSSFRGRGETHFLELEDGRGIRTLRGLDLPVGTVAFSADGKRLAVVSDDWRVGVWDCGTGRRLHVFEAPKGDTSDNSALAFDGTGTRLACMAGSAAKLWDLATGNQLDAWPLPAGLVDHLAFDARGDLIAVRCEPFVFEGLPAHRKNSVCVVRNLSVDDGRMPIFVLDGFRVKIISLALDPQGTWMAIEGDSPTTGGTRRTIEAYDISTGQRRWTVPCDKTQDYSSLHVDPTGKFLSYGPGDVGDRILLSMPEGLVVRTTRTAVIVGPGAEVCLTDDGGGVGPSAALYRGASARPFLHLRDVVAECATMDRSGNLIACGRLDGTVMLADLAAIKRNLEDVGLGW